VRQILAFLNEPTSLQYIAPVRGPPLWEMVYAWHGEFDARARPAQSTPDCEFNQRMMCSGQLDEDPISLDRERSCLGLSSGPSTVDRVTPGRGEKGDSCHFPGGRSTRIPR
jgi:hypothetical protein